MKRIREEGGNAQFYCFAGGQPKPGFSWSRKDKQPMSRRVFIKGKRLLIRGVKKEDEGTYLCTARNVYGSGISSGQLTVKGKTCLLFRVYEGVLFQGNLTVTSVGMSKRKYGQKGYLSRVSPAFLRHPDQDQILKTLAF